MKLEKVNDHQIRCTLTKADLADRHMKLSELAYGTDKAKSLFRDMLQQAAFEFGFEAEDIPLMIEAIPLSGECIVLIITKVEDPEELDTRFSKFAPSIEASDDDDSSPAPSVTAGDVLDLFKKLHDGLAAVSGETSSQAKETSELSDKDISVSVAEDIVRMFCFDEMDEAIRLAHVLRSYYDGVNSLYRCDDPHGLFLVIHKSAHTPEDFNKICNIAAEYGHAIKYSKGHDSFLSEHGELILENSALQDLSQL